jgi:hypothetical protein
MVTMHHGHHPEITLTDEATATGIWYLEDQVMDAEGGMILRGAAFYRDEYVKQGGEWKIRSTGYRRTWEEIGHRKDLPSFTLKTPG